MQAAGDEPLPKPADRRFIRHRLVRVKLHELLEAQAILELFFGLRIAQAVEVLQNHDAQQHADATGRASALAVGGRDAFFGDSEVHFAGDGFQDSVGAAALLHGQIKKGGLVLAFGLHGFLMRLHLQLFNYFCRDFLKRLSRPPDFITGLKPGINEKRTGRRKSQLPAERGDA